MFSEHDAVERQVINTSLTAEEKRKKMLHWISQVCLIICYICEPAAFKLT